MAQSQHLLVLANSTKNSGLCIAGRQIFKRDGKCYLGRWIRPVSPHGDGELTPEEVRLNRGQQPQIFDIVEVPLAGHQQDIRQPENWRIRARRPWRLADPSFRHPPLELLLERPTDLWCQPGERCDRVSAGYLSAHPPLQSLYLVVVENLQAKFGWSEYDGFYRERYRAHFSYGGIEYELNITDPRFIKQHKDKLPRAGDRARTWPLGKETAVCLSLAREFNGYHYKIVATILT